MKSSAISWRGGLGSIAALLKLLLTLSFAGITAFATTNSCPSTTGAIATRTFSGGAGTPTYTNITVPGNGTTTNSALTNANAENGTGLGCTAVDLTFNNFAVASSGTNESALPSALAEGNAGATYLAQTAPDTLLFSTLQGAGTGANSGDGGANDGTDNYKVCGDSGAAPCTTSGMSMTASTSFTVTDTKATGIYGVTLDINDITIASDNGGGGSGTASFYVCEGGAFVLTAGLPTSCTAGGTLVKDTGVTLVQEAVQSITLATPLHLVSLDVFETFTLTASGTTDDETGFLSFGDDFTESPEPSTFILIGTALAALAGMRFRRRNLA